MSEPLDKREEVDFNPEMAQRYEDRNDDLCELSPDGSFVSWDDYEKLLSANREKDAELSLLRSEAAENARIIGMSGSREAAKDAEIERLEGKLASTDYGGYASRILFLEAELASLRASAGEKPEDAYRRGQENMRDVISAALDMGGWTKLANAGKKLDPFAYVAPPTLPTEKENG
jgi:hypothetical protein